MTKIRIKEGARIFQDFYFLRWPNCKPPQKEYKDEKYQFKTKYPDAVFNAIKKDRYWDCWREGYGDRKDYGNGSIFVYDINEVEIVEKNKNG